jgi:hypothetical protein
MIEEFKIFNPQGFHGKKIHRPQRCHRKKYPERSHKIQKDPEN